MFWQNVALFTRAWIEISPATASADTVTVALFTRAWIEMQTQISLPVIWVSRPLHEGVD